MAEGSLYPSAANAGRVASPPSTGAVGTVRCPIGGEYCVAVGRGPEYVRLALGGCRRIGNQPDLVGPAVRRRSVLLNGKNGVDIAGFVDEPPGYGQRPRFWLAIIGIRR